MYNAAPLYIQLVVVKFMYTWNYSCYNFPEKLHRKCNIEITVWMIVCIASALKVRKVFLLQYHLHVQNFYRKPIFGFCLYCNKFGLK